LPRARPFELNRYKVFEGRGIEKNSYHMEEKIANLFGFVLFCLCKASSCT